MCVVAVCRRGVNSPRFLGVLWYWCTEFGRTDVPIGRCTAFSSCRCVFTYHIVCTSIYSTLPSWYRPIGEIAPGCLLSAAALPDKAVCIIYQFSIAPIGEMAPGVPCKALNKIIYLHYRTGMREMVPIGEMAPGCAKKYKKHFFLNLRTRCHLTHDYGNRNYPDNRVLEGSVI